MAKLTTHTTGETANSLVISRDEVIGILREKFPMIPAGRSVDIQFEVDACRDLNEVIVDWKSTSSDDPVEQDVQPVKAGCGLRVCLKTNPPEPLEPPPSPEFNPDESALDAMRPPEGLDEIGRDF